MRSHGGRLEQQQQSRDGTDVWELEPATKPLPPPPPHIHCSDTHSNSPTCRHLGIAEKGTRSESSSRRVVPMRNHVVSQSFLQQPNRSSLCVSDTSSSGGSCSSTNSRRDVRRLHAVLSTPTPRNRNASLQSPYWSGGGGGGGGSRGAYHCDESEEETLSLNNGAQGHHRLTRSCSFGGLLPNSNSSIGSPKSLKWMGATGILGQGLSPSNTARRQNSLPPHVKVPKSPRTERTQVLSTAVAEGLREAVALTHHDLREVQRARGECSAVGSQGRAYEKVKQAKKIERYLRQLEVLLSRLEDLRDEYELQRRLRDGVRNMAYAFALSPGKAQTSALTNVRSGFRECTEALCGLEARLEQVIGTLTLEMKGLLGFARLCPGDVFEVRIRHGTQKWKSRGRVTKDGMQIWDNPVYVFKALIGDMLIVKAMEVRILGKKSLIGQKSCDTKDLFSPHPQLMTVNMNASGSLKLNLVVTWNPLDGDTSKPLVRAPSLCGQTPTMPHASFFGHDNTSSLKESLVEDEEASSFGSISLRSSSPESCSPMTNLTAVVESQLFDNNNSTLEANYISNSNSNPPWDASGNFTLARRDNDPQVAQWAHKTQELGCDSRLNPQGRYSASSAEPPSTSSSSRSSSPFVFPAQTVTTQASEVEVRTCTTEVIEALMVDTSIKVKEYDSSTSSLAKLISVVCLCLEDVRGSFPVLRPLEEAVQILEQMAQAKLSHCVSSSSINSASIENALECFGFLDAEYDESFSESHNETDSEATASPLNSPSSLSNGGDPEAKIEEIAVASEVVPKSSSLTGNTSLDDFLQIHIESCLTLLQGLDRSGPLHQCESESLRQLQGEAEILSSVLKHKDNLSEMRPEHLMSTPRVQLLWESVAKDSEWFVTGDLLVEGLLPSVSSLIPDDVDVTGREVLESIVCILCGSPIYIGDVKVTAGHFLLRFKKSLQGIVTEEARKISLHKYILKGHDIGSTSVLLNSENLTLRHTKELAKMAKESCKEPKGETSQNINLPDLLQKCFEDTGINEKITTNCLMLLESKNDEERSVACNLLGLFSTKSREESLKKTLQPPDKEKQIIPTNKNDKLNKLIQNPSSECSTAVEDGQVEETLIKAEEMAKMVEEAAIRALSFLQQSDPVEEVRKSAGKALNGMGSIGQEAMRRSQLAANGFQGINVKEDTESKFVRKNFYFHIT